MTGTVTKLVPNDENRFEVRVKGPNVMAGYFEDPVKTTEAFDDEGFFITGDAMCFADPDDPNKGLRFDGRISEDFKLLTGTWVRAAQLRLDALAHFGPLASDIVVAGADRHQIGMLVFPNLEEVRNLGFEVTTDNGALNDPDLLAVIQNKLEERAGTVFGSSNTVARAIVVSEPASLADGEITAKGNLNFRKVLSERKHLLQRLYDDNDHGCGQTLRILNMIDLDKIRAIDIHTHAEEPCGCHSDDGYDELQSTMAKYFRAPWEHPPTVPETAAHYREQNIAAVIFPVDAERETGYRRYKNEEVAELAAENDDVLNPYCKH